jgi:hypothetical protein
MLQTVTILQFQRVPEVSSSCLSPFAAAQCAPDCSTTSSSTLTGIYAASQENGLDVLSLICSGNASRKAQ